MLHARERFGELSLDAERIDLSDSILQDPDYSDPVPGIGYDGRFNLRLLRRGAGGGRSLILNAHMDVVPPSEGMDAPWAPRLADGVLYGRGACDDKGPLASVYLALKALDALGVELKGDVAVHVVVEEEIGGNGSLAMARRGEKADGCVVLEPTDDRVFTSVRGAVWFRLKLSGKAGHSGEAGKTRSALLMAREAMGILEKYHADLLAASRGQELFDPYPNPMPLTFGRLEAGKWPSMAPSRAVLEGVLGFLPNVTREEVCEEMRARLAREGGDAFAGNFDLGFTYRHDSSVVDPGDDLPRGLVAACEAASAPARVAGMTASCDAWFYRNHLGIPTVVYGPGTLGVAHSRDEQIRIDQVAKAAEVLVRLMLDYCGGGRGT
jgi:acetylornithine deacetylase